DGVSAEVYLVCASQLVTVERPVPADAVGAEPVEVARALLSEVQRAPSAGERRAGFTTAVPAGLRVDPPRDGAPSAGERRAGFTTAVPAGLRVDPPRDGDPAGTLRLSSQPEDLSEEALAQLVCTYAESDALVRDGSVVLGGPGDYPPRGYLCTSQTKSRPGDLATPDALRLD
ncbi:hypothetical protein B5180_37950, partial [Streptomyces sp. BF-3]